MPVEDSRTRDDVQALFAAVPPPPLSAAVRDQADELLRRIPDADGAALVGGTLDDHTLVAVLGRGGQATVYLAEDREGRQFALKVPHHALVTRLVREAQILFHLDHPHVLRVERAEVKGETPYVITEYLPRGSLADRLRDQGPLPPDEVLALAGQILDALDYAHGKGVVHRDLKPSNVLFTAEGAVKVADFGIGSLDLTQGRQVAQTLVSSDRTVFAGTPLYMAPEQARTAEVDARADLYALGKLLYEALTGLTPRTIKPVSRLVPGLNPAWDDYLFRLLEERPEDRFPSAAGACQALPTRRWSSRPGPAPHAPAPDPDRAGPRLGEALGDWLVGASLDHDAKLSRYLVRSATDGRDAVLEVCTDALAPARSSRAERVLLASRARSLGLKWLDLDATTLTPEALELVPEAFARLHELCPVRRDGDVLTVALSDPVGKAPALDDLRFMLNLEVEPQLAAPDAVERALIRAYGGDPASSPPSTGTRRAARFLREAEWLASLPAHPRLLRVLACGEHLPSRRPYRVVAECPGDPLAERLVPGRPFPPATALQVVRGVAEALRVLHCAGGLHNNLTLAAITIGPDDAVQLGGGGSTVPLQDVNTSMTLSEAGLLLGTPLYMAPEIGRVKALDGRADLYSLGVVFYALLTGVQPLKRFSPLEILSARAHAQIAPPEAEAPDLPPGYRRVLGKLLAPDRDARYADAQALLEDLERLARGRAPRATEPELWPTPEATPPAAALGVWSKLAEAVWPRKPRQRESAPARPTAQVPPDPESNAREVDLVASIQARLAPGALPRTGRIEVSGQTIACDAPSGDFFDVMASSTPGDVHIGIGDASSQGLRTGLVALSARTTLRALAQAGLPPREVLAEANRLLYAETRRDAFVSALVLRWSDAADTLTWSGAGHEHLIVYRARTGRAEAIKAGGCVLAAVRDARHLFKDAELRLEPGDAVVLYTDGVTESRGPRGEFFAQEGLQPLLRLVERHGHQSAPELVAAVHRELRQFRAGAEQADDVTVVAIKRRADGEIQSIVDDA